MRKLHAVMKNHRIPPVRWCLVWYDTRTLASAKGSADTIDKNLRVFPPQLQFYLSNLGRYKQNRTLWTLCFWLLTDYWERLQEGILFLTSFRGKINSRSHAHFLFQPQLPQEEKYTLCEFIYCSFFILHIKYSVRYKKKAEMWHLYMLLGLI